MKHLSKALTMALLMGTTLNAAGYALTPYAAERNAPAAGAVVVAEQAVVPYSAAATTTTALTVAPTEEALPKVIDLVIKANNSSAAAVWDEIEAWAKTASEALNPQRMVNIRNLQQELLKVTKFSCAYPQLYAMPIDSIYITFQKALEQAVRDLAPERAVQLWRSLKTFLDENNLNDSGSRYYSNSSSMRKAISATARVEMNCGNIPRVLELWTLQQEVLLEIGFIPDDDVIRHWAVHNAFAETAKKTKNLTELMELWKKQQTFLIANPLYYPMTDTNTKTSDLIAPLVTKKLDEEIAAAKKAGNTTRVTELEAAKANVLVELQTSPLTTILETPEHKAVIDAAIAVRGSEFPGRHPQVRIIYPGLINVFKLALLYGDVPAAATAYELAQNLRSFQPVNCDSLGKDTIAKMIPSFLEGASKAKNPFRSIAAYEVVSIAKRNLIARVFT